MHLDIVWAGQLETQVRGLCMETFIWSTPCSASQASDRVGKLGGKNPESCEMLIDRF